MTGDGGVDESKRATLRRFAALGAATPFVGLASGSGESDVRDAITGYLATTPGAHFSKLRDDLQLGTGEAQHHLRRLQDAGAIEAHKDGEYRRYFPANRFSEFEQVVLGSLRRETPRGMLVALLEEPTRSAGDVAEELDVSLSTVSSHAADLEDSGILSREDGYAVRAPTTVLTLLVRYADSFDAAAVDLADDAADLLSYDP